MPCSVTQDELDYHAREMGYRDEAHQIQHERAAMDAACEAVKLLHEKGMEEELSKETLLWWSDHVARDGMRRLNEHQKELDAAEARRKMARFEAWRRRRDGA